MTASLASWVPGDILAAILLAAIGYLFKRILDDNSKTSLAISRLAEEIQSLKISMTGFATIEQLGRMGDRFDSRTTELAKETAVIKAVMGRAK